MKGHFQNTVRRWMVRIDRVSKNLQYCIQKNAVLSLAFLEYDIADLMKRGIIIFLLCASSVVLGDINIVKAEKISSPFQKKMSYDIYFAGTEKKLVHIRDVEIVGFEIIQNKTFLVVKPTDFTLNKKEGYILFDSVRVILPHRGLKVSPKDSVNIRFR